MAIVKEIDIVVNSEGAEAKIRSLTNEIDNVGKTSEKSMDRYSGAIKKSNPLVEKLNQITGGLSNTLLDVSNAAKKAGISMRTAMVATGVGAFVVALGVVLAYWDDIAEAIDGTNKKLQEQLDTSIKIQESIRLQLSLAEKQLTLAEKQGGAIEGYRKQRLDILNTLRKENDQEIKLLEIQAAKLKSSAFELTTREKILKTILNTIRAGDGDALILENQLEAANKYKELQDAITKAKEEQVDLDLKLFDINNPKGTDKKEATAEKDNTKIGFDDSVQKRIDDEIKAIEEIARIRQEFADKNREDELVKSEVERERKLLELENLVADEVFKREAIAEVNKFYNQQAIDLAKEKADKEAEIEKEKNEKIKADEERLRDAKFAIANQTLNVLGMLAKEGSDLSKGIAASQATINTFQGVVSALSTTSVIPDPFGTILKFANAAAIGVAGFINVKKILSTKPVTKSASGGGSGVSAPPAPSFNLVEGTGSNQIADSIQGGQKPIKAFVVSSDVSSSQEMDRNIEGSATL